MNRFTLQLMACAMLYALATQSQTIHGVAGAGAGMQGGTSTVFNDAFSVINNPSQLSLLKKWQSGLYHERRFNRQELSLSGVCMALPTRIIDVGFGLSQFGFSTFNQQRFVMSASKKLAPTLSIGIQLNYELTRISEYGKSSAWVMGGGISYQPTAKIHIGFVVYNPNQQQLSEQISDKIPSFARLGLKYLVNEKVHCLAESEQQTNLKTIFRGGVRYEPHKRVALAVGASSGPISYSFGTSVLFGTTAIDMAAAVHQVLGVTPQISLRYPASTR